MSKHGGRHLFRGAIAGAAGGLAASWLMNQFIAGPGKKLQESVQESIQQEFPEAGQKKSEESSEKSKSEESSATMNAADLAVEISTGGRHLSREGKQKGGPIVHYGYGTLAGGLYGGVAEYWAAPKAGFGTMFGTALFCAGDLIAVPALHLSPSSDGEPVSEYVNPFLSHLVYGAATELVRRSLRAIF